jgi:hypothetical protein
MIDFAALVTGLFLILVVLLFIMQVRFFRHPPAWLKLSPEWRAVLLLVAFIGSLGVSLATFMKLSHWKSEYRKAREVKVEKQYLNSDLLTFVRNVYAPLASAHKQLQVDLDGVKNIRKKMEDLIRKHPNHKEMLTNINNTLQKEVNKHQELYNNVDREIRNAWLHSTTQNRSYVEEHFHNRAVVLFNEINIARNRLNANVQRTGDLVEASLIEAKKILQKNSNQKKKSGKKNKNTPSFVQQYQFRDATANTLLEFMTQVDPDLVVVMKKMSEEIRLARSSRDTLGSFKQQNKDLVTQIDTTIGLWSELELQAQTYWAEILYAVEAEYLARQMNMPAQHPQLRRLHRTLRSKAIANLNRVRNARSNVENSFPDISTRQQ